MPQLAAAGFWQKLLTTVIVSGLQYLYGRHERKKQERAAKKRVQAIDVEYAGSLEPRRRLYGDFRCAGLNILPAITLGPEGEDLVKGLVISDCAKNRLEEIESITFNNDVIPVADIGLTGLVEDGHYENFARILMFNGKQSWASITPYLNFWTMDHDGFDLAGIFCVFSASNEVYTQGAPAVVVSGKGVRVYDPRLDTSPGDDLDYGPANVFSKTPPLQLVDFLLWPSACNEQPERIHWDDVVEAADDCEGSVTIPSGTQDRYTSSVEVYAPQTLSERNETLRMLAKAMMGIVWYSGGKWRMRAGVYRATSGTITDADVLDGDFTFQPAPSLANGGVFNAVRGSYVDQIENTQPKTFPEVLSTTFEAEDGERRYKDVEYRTARTHTEAQRNAILELRQARTRQTVAGTFRFRVWKFVLWDTVTVTLSKIGWAGVTARITSMKLNQNFTVNLELERISEDDFDDPTTPDYTTPNSVGPPESAGFRPGAPRNLTAVGIANGIIFSWDAPLNAPGVLLYQLFEYTSVTPFSSATQIGPDTAQNSIVVPKSDTTTRYYWVRAKLPDTGQVGTQSPASSGVPGAAASATGGLSAIVTPGSAEIVGFSASLQTDEVFVTALAGTSPYTYATSFTSGGTGITINDGTTSSPYFSATGLSEGETRTGTARIRVTDNVAATYDVFVTVSITRGYDAELEDTTITATGGATSPAIAIYTVTNTGEISTSPLGGGYDWLNPAGDPADFDVRFTLNSGTTPAGSGMGTWLHCANVLQLRLQRDPGNTGTSTCNITVEVRMHDSPFTVLDSATLIMTATIT